MSVGNDRTGSALQPSPPLPLRARPLDVVIVGLCVLFFFTSVLFDRLAALDHDFANTTDPLGRAFYAYAARVDPLVLDNPLWLRVMSGISAFGFGPAYLGLAWAFARGWQAIRPWALLYAAAMSYSMVVFFAMQAWGGRPPTDGPLFVATYAGYVALPLLILARVWRPLPFSPEPDRAAAAAIERGLVRPSAPG